MCSDWPTRRSASCDVVYDGEDVTGTKTIGVKEDVYDRLKARKRDGESFTDLVDRLLDEAQTD
ncbi:hypothetical protein HUB97_07390 [Halorubraceae archaeon YAN]|nr:hypothetical protein [Halorubraceae archaeon YAN]